MTQSSTGILAFRVENTSSETILWVKVSRPDDSFTVNGASAGGWNASNTEEAGTFSGGSSIAPSGSAYFSLNVTAGGSVGDPGSWTVEVSDDSGGSSPTTCTGDTSVSITEGSGGGDTTAPTISDIVVSDISDTQAKITWTTDESGTTVVDYGTTDDYGSTATGDSGTSHSVTISSLTANTTYHYNVKSADSAGNTGESGDNTFVTAKQGTTTTTTVTGTTRTITATGTPTPVPDRTPPKTTIVTTLNKPFTEAPTIEGKATDPSGVAKLEYSIDDGRNFLPIDEVEGLGKASATFTFTPLGLLDDNYIVKIRATDSKGNTGTSKGVTMVVDRLPPLVGGVVLTLGPQVIEPTKDGALILLPHVSYNLTLSAVGGPTDIRLVGNLGNLGTLRKNLDNGLWSTTIRFDTSGMYTLWTHAIDGAGNIKDHAFPSFTVVEPGRVFGGSVAVTNGTLVVYVLHDDTKRFILWDGEAYGQNNPLPLSHDGSYALYLPAGTYYLEVRAPGYTRAISQIFWLDKGAPIVEPIYLTRKRALRLGPFLIPLPDFRQTTIRLTLTTPSMDAPASSVRDVTGEELPYFRLPSDDTMIASTSLRGKPTIITFLNSWLPHTPEQLAVLQELAQKKEIHVVSIFPQETAAAVSIFRKRGDYAIPIIADPDGTLIEALGLTSFPAHVFVSRKGIIERVATGLLTKEELLDNVLK